MKRLVLLLMALSMLTFSFSCSDGNDDIQLGDECGIHKCVNDTWYHCLDFDQSDNYVGKYDFKISCEQVCQQQYPVGDWDFTGSCGETLKGSYYYGCCNCYNANEGWEECAFGLQE